MSHGTTANHGAGIPTQDTGVTSNMGMLLALGPRVRAGIKRDSDRVGPIPIHSIGVTVAALLGCRAPRHATGGILHDMLLQDASLRPIR